MLLRGAVGAHKSGATRAWRWRCSSASSASSASAIGTSGPGSGARLSTAAGSGPPAFASLPSRAEQLSRLRSAGRGDAPLDVLVVGGGATGCGAALDAASRGLRVGLVERADFSSETSSRSTKLVWAGLRYIATAVAALLRWSTLSNPVASVRNFVGEFKMVLGAHKERRILLDNNPHLTRWVAIAVPVERWLSWPPPMGHPLFAVAGLMLPLVFKFYDSLCGFSCPPSYVLSKQRAASFFPQLDAARMKYTQVFYEGMHNDARTCLSIALTAAEHGAAVANYCEAVDVLRDEAGAGAGAGAASGSERVTGVVVRDGVTGERFEVRARAVVFCGGPFTDALRRLEEPGCKPAVAGAAGTHIVLAGYYVNPDMGLLDMSTSDGRFLFFLPWQGHTVVGTTDKKGDPVSSPQAPEEEIRWILNEVRKYLAPSMRVRRSDVLSAWRGWRPLATNPHAPPGAPPSRDHTISHNPRTGVVSIAGGKWTTYREMAEDVVDRVVREKGWQGVPRSRTAGIKLCGGEGYDAMLFVRLVQTFNISAEVAQHLAHTYGARAHEVCRLTRPTPKLWPRFGVPLVEGYPYLENEVEFAVRHEYALTVKDVLALRTRLAFLNSEAAKLAAPRVAHIMAPLLGWSEEQREQQLADALAYMDCFGGPYPKEPVSAPQPVAVADLRQLFHRLDHDGSGYLERSEVANAARTLGLGDIASAQQLDALFDRLPGAQAGRVYEKDFCAFFLQNLDKDEVVKRVTAELKLSVDKLEDNARGVMFG